MNSGFLTLRRAARVTSKHAGVVALRVVVPPEEVAQPVLHVGVAEPAVAQQQVGVGADDQVGAGVGQGRGEAPLLAVGALWPSVPQCM